MELSQEFLIDMAINAGGYLLAGVISVLLYTLFQNKAKTTKVDETIEELIINQNTTVADEQIEKTSNKKVEFITFGNEQNSTPKTINRVEPQLQSNGRMNRKEAINLAKKMLVAGATHEKIKKVLPVSDSELALLSLNIK